MPRPRGGVWTLAAILAVWAVALSACSGRPVGTRAEYAEPIRAAKPKTPEDIALSDALSRAMDGLDRTAYGAVSAAQSEGRVLLTGAVVRPDYRRRLEQMVSVLPGVMAVSDAVQVVDGPSLTQYQPDTAKERDIVQRFALPGIALRVVKGVVYLVGQAADREEIDALRDGLADDAAIKWIDASAVVYSPKM